MGMSTGMGVIFENRYGCGYSSTRPKPALLSFLDHIIKELREEIQLPIFSKWKLVFSIGGKIIFLKNSFPSSTMSNKRKLKNHFLRKLFPPKQTLPKFRKYNLLHIWSLYF